MSGEEKVLRFHNELAGGAYEMVVQAGVVHGGVHVNQTAGDSPSALENPVIVTVHRKAGARLAVDADPPRVMEPSGSTYIVTLEAWTTRAVVLRAARVVVLSRRIPRPACREGFIGARPSVRHFETNLDRHVEPRLPGFDAGSPRLDPVGPDFPFTISATDVEQFRFTAHANAEEVRWQVELDWICAGREGTAVINDNGRPFETYPVQVLDAAPGSWALRHRCEGSWGACSELSLGTEK
ncbi:hypothetical protein [Amycolatopsis sp. lyj-346]|uniref:hypothetical protein n=1 Tax=Amycolatopsis sp. lyj-346 TaxID=2789289 RepID=UPI00397DC221